MVKLDYEVGPPRRSRSEWFSLFFSYFVLLFAAYVLTKLVGIARSSYQAGMHWSMIAFMAVAIGLVGVMFALWGFFAFRETTRRRR